MKIFKKFIFIFVIFSVFFITGCQEPKVQFARNAEGTLTEIYTIPFSAQEFYEHANIDYEDENSVNQLRTDIYGVQSRICRYIEDDIQKKINTLLLSISANDNIDYSIADVAKSIEVTKPKENILYNEGLIYSITFPNATIYNMFYEINTSDIESSLKNRIYKKGFLTNTTLTEVQPYLDKTINSSNDTLLKKYINIAATYVNPLFTKYNTLDENGKNLENYILENQPTTYIYEYSVPSARFKSNADSVTRTSDGYYNHTWTISMNNSSLETPKTIYTWYVTANRPVWYTIIVGSSLIFMAIIFMVSKLKDKKVEIKQK